MQINRSHSVLKSKTEETINEYGINAVLQENTILQLQKAVLKFSTQAQELKMPNRYKYELCYIKTIRNQAFILNNSTNDLTDDYTFR